MALSVAQEHLDTAVALDPSTLQDSTSCHSVGHSHELLPNEMEEVDYESLPTERLSAHLVAGAAAGMMEHCAMYPVDCVKTRMMMLLPDPKANYRNLFQAFHKIIKYENPRALFRGISVVATGAGPAHALYFSCYEFAKKGLSKGKESNVLAQGGAGAIATLVHDGLMVPIDVVKQRLQMYNSPYKSTIHCIRTVYNTEGPRAFYRSYTTQLSMNIPFQVIHFISYEFLQDELNYSRQYDPLSHMFSGAGAGACAAALTTPLDVAKTLLNTQEQRRSLNQNKRISGMVSAMLKIYTSMGVRGFFRGVTARVVYQMPSTAICWSIYEFFKHMLGLKQHEFRETSSSSPDPPS